MTGLQRARAALEQGEWQEALHLLSDVEGAELDDEALQIRAAAAYGAGDFELTIQSWESVHDLRRAAGDVVGAGQAACFVALYLLIDTGMMTSVRGWLGRADRLLAPTPDAAPHAMVAMIRGYERFFTGDYAAARVEAERAVRLGEREGFVAAVVIGRTCLGRLRILEGDVAEGMALLEEVAVELMSGDVDALTTGMMYCELICAAQGLALHDRAREWTEVMERWRHGVAFGGIHGRCRIHRAELLRLSGPAADAEAEATAACAELRPWLRREFGWPLAELGTIRLRRGDLDGAEEAFLEAHRHVWSPEPGLALLRLAQGHGALATRLIAEAIAHPVEMPSKERPPFVDLSLAPLLDAQAEIAEAMGDVAAAADAAERLEAIATTYDAVALGAVAALARARWQLLTGDGPAALVASTRAATVWAELGAPYEMAVARLVTGHAHRQLGHHDTARLEWESARAAFEAFGALGRVREVDALLGGPPEPATAPREQVVFSRVGDCRRIVHRGSEVLVPDLVGFRHIERLVAEPGREFHVLDLVAWEQGHATSSAEGGLPALDDEAKRAYQRRLAEIDEDIEEADADHDLARRALAERDREYLVAELARAVGWAGRIRTTGGDDERARTSVTRSVRYALGRLTEHHPELGRHLGRAIRTGVYCRFEPDELSGLTWNTTPGPIVD